MAVASASLLPVRAQTTYYWDGNGATTGAGTNAQNTATWNASTALWSTSPTGVLVTGTATITNLDTVVFTANDNVAADNPTGGYTVTLGAAQSVAGIVIGSSGLAGGGGTLTLTGTGSPGITIGAGGLTLNGSNGDPTFNANLGTVTLAADQTWTVNNAHVWAINSAIAGNATTGNTRTLTLGFVNAFTNTYSGVIGNGSGGGELALTLNNTNGSITGGGTQSITGTASTYTGKTTVMRGVLQIASLKDLGVASSLGAPTTAANGTIDLGSGTNVAQLYFNGSAASSSNRVINLSGTTVGGTLKNNSTAATSTLTLTGGITNAGGGNKVLTLAGTNAGANLISGVIADAGDLSTTGILKNEAGFWTLGGANTYTGGTTVNAGTLAINSTGTLGANTPGNTITIAGGNLLLNAASNVGNNQTVTVTASGGGIGVAYDPVSFPTIVDNSGATGGVFGLNYTGTGGIGSLPAVDALFTSGSSWSLGSFAGGSGTFTGTSLQPGAGSTYRIGGGGGTISFANNILVGANNVIIGSTGGGIVNMTNGNTYSGKTTIRNGTANVASLNSVVGGAASSSLGAPTTVSNGTIDLGSAGNAVVLNYTGAGETTDRVLNFSGTTGGATISNSGTGTLDFTSAPTFTGSGSRVITLGAATDSLGGSIGPITNGPSGTIGVTKNGLTSSIWVLNGTSTYTGTTQISGGVLQVSAASSLSGSYINITGGAATRLGVLQTQGTIARTLSGTASASNANWGAFGGFAAKGGSLTVTMNANTALTWGSGNFLGAGTDPLVFGSSTSDDLVEFTNPVNLNTGDQFNRVVQINGTAATIAGGTANFGLSGSRALLSGVLSGGVAATSATGFTKTGSGTVVLSGLNTYQGITLVSAGTLVAGNNVPAGGVAGAFGTGAGATATPATTYYTIQVGDAATTTGNASPTVLIGGAFTIARPISINNNATTGNYGLGGSTDNNATFSGLITASQSFRVTQAATTGGNALSIAGGITGGATAATKTVTFANAGSVNVSTTAISDGAGGGKIAVAQTGAGTTTLSFANTYTGATTVSAGTLLASASSGQALGGTVDVTISGGTLQLGQNDQINDAATMTLSGGTFNTAGLSETVGVLTLASSSVIDLGNVATILHFANSSGVSWTGTLSIWNYSGGTDQIFFGDSETGLNFGQVTQINFYSGAGVGFLGTGQMLSTGELTAVPEPGAYAFGIAGLLALIVVLRRRRTA